MGQTNNCPLWVISGRFATTVTMSAFGGEADIKSKMCFLGLEALRARPAASGLRPPLEPNALGEQSMRTVALSLLTLGLPGIALADGGHPDTKDLLVGDQVVISSKLTFSRIGIIGTENL